MALYVVPRSERALETQREPAERAAAGPTARPDETMTAVNPASPTVNGGSLWPRLAGLPLIIEASEYDRLHAVLAYEFERITTHVRAARRRRGAERARAATRPWLNRNPARRGGLLPR